MILRIHVEFHFEQTGRHLEIADEKMVYRGTFEQLQYGLIAPILPIEPNFVLVRNQIDQLLNPVVPQIARPLGTAPEWPRNRTGNRNRETDRRSHKCSRRSG